MIITDDGGAEWDRLRKRNEMTWAEMQAAVAYDPSVVSETVFESVISKGKRLKYHLVTPKGFAAQLERMMAN